MPSDPPAIHSPPSASPGTPPVVHVPGVPGPRIATVAGSLTYDGNPIVFPILYARPDLSDYQGLSYFNLGYNPSDVEAEVYGVARVNGTGYNWILFHESLSIINGNAIRAWTSASTATLAELIPSGAWHATTNPLAWKPEDEVSGVPSLMFSGGVPTPPTIHAAPTRTPGTPPAIHPT
jgi:hypothetical protein